MSALDGWIDVCRAGTWTDSQSREVTVTASDFDAMVSHHATSDPVPIVVGHPEIDAPAYAWVSALRRVGDRLQAKLRDICPEFRSAVEASRYSGRSIAATADNRLVHVGFLGGRAPAIPGLTPTQFSTAPSKVITLASGDLTTRQGTQMIARVVLRLFRALREQKIEADGVESADSAYPAWEMEHLTSIAKDLENDDIAPRMAGPDTIEEDPDVAPKTLPDPDIAARTAELDAREAKLATDEKAAQTAARLASARATIAPHVTAGRILPAEEPSLAALLASLPDGDDKTITFAAPGDGGEVTEKPAAVLERLLAALPPRVDYQERAGGDIPPGPTSAQIQFAAPPDTTVDQDSMKLHQRATQLAAERKIDYREAVIAAQAEGAVA